MKIMRNRKMDIGDKMGFEIEMSDYIRELFENLPLENEKQGINLYKKGVMDSYYMFLKCINEQIKK
jgi:hypothetical protein